MRQLVHAHFEVLLLAFIFIFACIMLACFPMREELARWIENGAIITIIARSMGTGTTKATTTTTHDPAPTPTPTPVIVKTEPTP